MGARKVTQWHGDAVSQYGFVKWVMLVLVALILGGFAWREWSSSEVANTMSHRFNMVVASTNGQVAFVSFDPIGRQIFVLPFPPTLSIRSRSVGVYTMSSLYALGSYGGNAADAEAMAAKGGEFVREKVQGFMLVPIPGYLVTNGSLGDLTGSLGSALTHELVTTRGATSLTWLDALVLRARLFSYSVRSASVDDLVRAGVLQSGDDGAYIYYADRLQQYVGSRLFDWNVGEGGVTVAVLNGSGVDGLGNDVADFLSNVGFDVVMVRTAPATTSLTQITIGTHTPTIDNAVQLVASLFHFHKIEVANIGAYRSDMLVTVGADAINLF